MKTTVKTRTPRRVLAVFLSILMLFSSFVFVNPTVSKAATSITHTPNYQEQKGAIQYYPNHYGDEGGIGSLGSFSVRNVETYLPKNITSSISADAVYDYNPNATNYTVYTYALNNKTISYPSDMYVSASATSVAAKHFTIFKMYDSDGDDFYITICVYPINTTNMMNAYDTAMNNYGTSNPGYYTNDSWEVYINALNYVRGIINKGVYDSWKAGSNGATNLQNFVYKAEQRLRSGMISLQKIEVTIGNVFKQVPGATITGPDRITIGTNFDVNVNLHDGYTQSVPGVRITYKDGTSQNFTGTNIGNNNYKFTVKITSENIDKITPYNVNLNTYNVSVPGSATGLKIGNGGSHTVTHNGSFQFTVTKQTGYTQKTPVVKVNGTQIAGVPDGNTYTYTISSIKENKTVTIDNLSLNEYSVSYNLGTGSEKTSDSVTKLVHGKNGTVKITVGDAYSQRKPAPTVDKGAKLTPVSNDGKTYVYTLSGVIDDVTVTVPSLNKNTYSAVLPSGEGYTAKSNDDLANIVYGSSISFGIDLDEQYNRSKVVVKYNGTVLEPAGGVYTISNITNNITKDMITVEGVKLNDYYIALPLESQPGFTIEVGEGLNAKAVRSGTSFNFKLFLDPAYSQSDFTIKYSKDGGEHYTVLEKDSNGSYVIEPVLSDYIVVVDGVKKNTYTVKFLDPDGNVDETVADVEYGSEAKYPGANEPSKANKTISDKTVDGVRTVVEKKYTFIGWSQDTSNVTSDMTVSPIFEVSEVKTTYPKEGGTPTVVVTPKTANVLFISDGIIVHKETVEKGVKFSGWDGTPVKTSKNPYETYKFIGWDLDKDGVVDVAAGKSTAIDSVKDDVMFIAVFESNLPSQTVTFKNFDGSEVLYSAKVKRGEEAKYELPGSPVRRDNTNLYDFAGWSLEKDADETKIVEKVLVAESDITLYAAYKKTPIVYSYKYINDGTVLQEGTFNNGDYYAYLGATPTREPTASTVYTFKTWKVVQSGYDTVYTAVYSEAVREYETKLPASTEAFDITDNATVKYGETFTFTVTLKEGYEETAPNVTSAGKAPKLVSTDGNSYTYEIKLDGATYEDVVNDLTVSVGATINNYDVNIVGDSGCEVVPTSINSDHGGNGSFTVTLKEGYTQTPPTVTVDGKLVLSAPEIGDGKYVYTISEIKSDATITVTTKINEYNVVLINTDEDNTVVFSGKVKHGEAPKYTNPTKPTDRFGGYTFIGWDTDKDGVMDAAEIKNVTKDIEAVAVYNCNHVHKEDPTKPGDDNAWELNSTDKATCTKPGTKHYVCTYPGCGATKDVTIHARGHNYGDWSAVTKATCTKNGEKIHYCLNAETDDYAACNHSEKAVIEKRAHVYGEWITVTPATCTEDGKKVHYCTLKEDAFYSACNHSETGVIPATGHHDSDGDYKCDDCGADLGHCSSCICHKGNVLSKVIRKICTILSKTFHTKIKCCKCMKWYGDEISSIS